MTSNHPQCPDCFGSAFSNFARSLTKSGADRIDQAVIPLTKTIQIQTIAFCLVFAIIPGLFVVTLFARAEGGIDAVDILFGAIMILGCGAAFWGILKALTIKNLVTNHGKDNVKRFTCEICGLSWSIEDSE